MTPSPATAFTLQPFDYAEARALIGELGLAEPVAVTLVRRGYRSVEQAREFLAANEDHDPFEFAGMSEVVERIGAAIGSGRRITVHGDYDVDGVCATAILVGSLRELGADCDWLIPGRLEEGYGLTAATVDRLAERGTSLLLTVDCGIGAVAEVEAAQAAGIEVIVTDHHQPGPELPGCPVLHPVVSGYPFAELCGTGVAYKLAVGLRGAEAAERELDLVALATVADLVPLRGENRALVRRGIAEARRGRRSGLRALIAAAGVVPERLDEQDMAFRLGPRINAAGRLYRADAGVELMLTGDERRAGEIAVELERANRERREVEREVLVAAERARSELPSGLAEAAGLVLAGAGWHPGVVGIVASRLVERHHRPIVLIGLDGEGGGRGSARSVPGFDLLAALDSCAEYLGRYGGHRAAAGLEIEAACVDGFREAFAAVVADGLPEASRVRSEAVDAVVGGESLGQELAEQLERLAPFGAGNPGVRLLVPGASVADVRPMGEGDRHARFSLRSGGHSALGVAFGVEGSLASAAATGPCDVSLRLELNEWNGAVSPRVVLGELYRPPDEEPARGQPGPAEIGAEEFWRRHDAEADLELGHWPPPTAAVAERREEIDRRDGSGIAALAALASGGEPVLALCADALRRRELVERVVRPARFGGGEPALVSARLPDETARAAEQRVLAAGAGLVLADWGALERDPALAGRYRQLVFIDPPAHPHLERIGLAGTGFAHRLDGPQAARFALQVHSAQWPSRAWLAAVFRALTARARLAPAIEAALVREVLEGEGRSHGLAPEPCGRTSRVLSELGIVRWEGSGANRSLGVVSSSGTDLERSGAFLAYRERYEDGKRFLSRVQTPS